jgi:DNA (cytosine-5)-methyltransferase 1
VSKKLNYIDLFAGAGGLSEGFINAGYNSIAHVEMDEAACHTLKTRTAYHFLKTKNKLCTYFSYQKGEINREQLYSQIPKYLLDSIINEKIDRASLTKIFERIDDILKKDEVKIVDIIIGGPPCQAYSHANQSMSEEKLKDDERNYLYKDYARFLIKYKPKLFLFENVPGLYTANGGLYYKNRKKYFKGIGYHLDDETLNAADFGVLQRRERVILIGWRKDLKFSYPQFRKVKNNWKVKKLFEDLPSLKPGDNKMVDKYTKDEASEYLKRFEIRNGVDFVTHNIARPHNEKDLKIYALAIDNLVQGIRLKNDKIPKEMRTQANTSSFLDRFKVVNENDFVSHTMIAHIAKDGHHYIHPDKEQLRSLSVREAARIQSFPDDYFFEGTKEKQIRTAAFRQIGNAVPPLMAKKIAKAIGSQLRKI